MDVTYQVLVDRYSRGKKEDRNPWPQNGPHFMGGTLNGLTERLEYIQSLGATAIWITPVNQASAYHGYHPTNYYDIERRFGTIDDLCDLTDEAHKRDMKIIMDFVANHVSKEHRFFQDAQKNPQSPYRNWFHFHEDGSYKRFLGFDDIPKLNLDDPRAREHVIGAAQFWLEQGIDGYRLDHVIGPKDDFWVDFRDAVKESNPNTILIGEACAHGDDWNHLDTLGIGNRDHYANMRWQCDPIPQMMRHYHGVLDGVLDFHFKNLLQDFARGAEESWVQHQLNEHYAQFPHDFQLVSFLDSHDMPRYLHAAWQSHDRLVDAVRIQMQQQQPAVIYYGTEVGMTQNGGFGPEPHSDLQAREPMNWHPVKEQEELRNRISALINERTNVASMAA